MLPTPLSWRVSKDERDDHQATLYDFTIDPDVSLDNPTSPLGTFSWWDGERVEFNEIDRYIGVHNASEDRNIKRKGESTVYRYEAIATGKVFSAAILSEDDADLQILRPFLDEVETN